MAVLVPVQRRRGLAGGGVGRVVGVGGGDGRGVSGRSGGPEEGLTGLLSPWSRHGGPSYKVRV